MKYIIAAALMSVSVSANATGGITAETCASVQNTARMVMELRQDNFPMSDLMGEFQGAGQESVQDMIVEAYDRPYFRDDSYSSQEISQFSNKYAAKCYKLKARLDANPEM